MSKAKYSPSNGGIYPTNAYKKFPQDAVDIPDDLYLKFQSGEISGITLSNNIFVATEFKPSTPSKESLLSSITVTTQSGNTFDGNETARNNMLSAIMAADIIGQTESQWKLADNTVETITLTELKEALTLSIQRVGEIVLSN